MIDRALVIQPRVGVAQVRVRRAFAELTQDHKARADLLGIQGEYNFYPCGLGAYFWKYTGLDHVKFRDFLPRARPTPKWTNGFAETRW